MKKIQFILAGLLVALMTHISTSMAEDIDLYSGITSGAAIPNVLIVIDNAANFDAATSGACAYSDAPSTPVNMAGKLAGLEQCALNNVIDALPTNTDGTARVNIGLMVYGSTGVASSFPSAGCASSNDGGCLISQLTAMTATNKTALKALIKSWTTGNIKANAEGTALAMQEAWAYYAGSTGASGRSYTAIKPPAGCQNNFVIFLGNAYNNVGTPGDSGSPSTMLATAGATDTSTITIPYPQGAACNTSAPYYAMGNHTDSSGLYADEWTRFMYKNDLYGTLDNTQSITTYTIAALGASCKPNYPALLTSMALHGGGSYFPVSADSSGDIVQAFLKILNEVQAVDSVFSSSSLPVSVNAQGTFLNQIYMGMFRPDDAGLPRWVGNMKQYSFIATRSTAAPFDIRLSLGDSLGVNAISAAETGFITPNAVSYWTCGGSPSVRACSPVADLTGGFWANDPKGAGLAYDLADGDLVDKGGAAQMMRLASLTADYTTTPGSSTNPRKLYTYCPSGSGCNATLSNTTNVFDPTNAAITDTLLKVGPRTISSITSAATVSSGVSVSPGASGSPATVSITALSKSSSTVTATVSTTDASSLTGGMKLKINTGASKYDCNPCTVISVGTTSFTYSNSGGSGSATLPSVATIYSNFATVTKTSHGLSIGQLVTIKACTTHTALNNTVNTITAITTNNFTIALATSIGTTGADTACTYTPNIATATTTTSHGFATGESITISGITPSGYNGTWTITPTGATTFSYQYTDAAPLANSSTIGTATGTSVTRDGLIKWVRGEDNVGDEQGPGGAVTIRPSVHGDVLHSRPVALNYGGNTGVVVYYGANDGVYRAVNGNQTAAIGTTTAGGELWGFIPRDFFGKLKRLHTNSPDLLLPSTPSGILPAPESKDYFADGSTSVYQLLNADGTTNKAYIYLAMRRGGNFIYALDVSAPANPVFLWKIGQSGLTTPSGFTAGTDFAELGQTWSAPKVALIKGYNDGSGNAKPVMIFGAGYSTTQDTQPATADNVGRGVYIVDAVTGALVWRATYGTSSVCSGTATKAACTVLGMNHSIPSDITLMDRDNDGYIDRLYAADVGGNVWRIDLQRSGSATNNTPDFWRVNQVASLGGGGVPLRKFFFPPDVIPTSSFDAVIIGSGDREHPLSSTSTRDRIFVLKDTATGNDGSGLTTIANSDLYDATTTLYSAATGTNKGYFKDFLAGEKGVNAPLTVAGYTYYGTNQPIPPSSTSCTSNLGQAKGYRLDSLTGAVDSKVYYGGGLPPSPVAGVVNVRVQGESTDSSVPFCIGCGGNPSCVGVDCNSALGGGKPPINVPTSRTRTYWYQEID